MKPKTAVAMITLAALPFFAAAAAQHADHQSQATAPKSTASAMMAGHAMGQDMMNLIDQVKNDLAALANENDLAVLHKRLAQNKDLLEQIQTHMSGQMQGMKEMKGCPGMVHQPQK